MAQKYQNGDFWAGIALSMNFLIKKFITLFFGLEGN
jgi:hypothetical protein